MYTRTRTKGHLLQLPAVGPSVGSYFNGNTITSALAPMPVFSTGQGPYVCTRDCKVPRFYELRAAGKVFCNPFHSSREIRVVRDTAWGHIRTTPLYPGEPTSAFKGWEIKSALHAFGSALSSTPGGTSDPYGPDLAAISEMRLRNATAADIAYQAAMADMASTSALMLVTLGELHKTVDLLGHYAGVLNKQSNPLVKLWTRVKRGQISRNEALGILGSEWMAFRYGVMPTLYEIRGVVEALRKTQLAQRQTARGKHAWSDSFTRTLIAPQGAYQATDRGATTTVSAVIRAGILFEPLGDSLSDRLGLSFKALPETAFELAKWSWMADWFMNLSDTVRALSAPWYGRFLCGWVTETLECHTRHSLSAGLVGQQTVTVNGVVRPTVWSYSSPPTSATVDVFYTTKTRTPQLDMQVRMPRIRNRMSTTHVADALALVAQNVSTAQKTAKFLRI